MLQSTETFHPPWIPVFVGGIDLQESLGDSSARISSSLASSIHVILAGGACTRNVSYTAILYTSFVGLKSWRRIYIPQRKSQQSQGLRLIESSLRKSVHGVPTNVDLYIETIVICDAMNYSLTDLRLRRAAMPPQIYAHVSSFDEDMTTTAAFIMYLHPQISQMMAGSHWQQWWCNLRAN